LYCGYQALVAWLPDACSVAAKLFEEGHLPVVAPQDDGKCTIVQSLLFFKSKPFLL